MAPETDGYLFEAQDFRHAMSQFATGVVVVAGSENGELVGFAAQSFVSLSLDPPLIAVCPQKTSTSWPRIKALGQFTINVLAASQSELSNAFAVPGEVPAVTWEPSELTGMPVIDDVIMHLDCALEAEHDAGDHTIAVAKVLSVNVPRPDAGPLLYCRATYGDFSPL